MEDDKKINGKTADEWFNIALNEKDLNKQIEYYSNCLKLNPKHVDAWNNKGLALGELKRHDDAIEAYNKAIEIADYAYAWYNKGFILGELKKYDDAKEAYKKAIKLFEKAIEINPDDADALISKALVHIELEQYEEATDCNKKALKINPELNPTAILQIYESLKYELNSSIENNQNDIINLTKKLYDLIKKINDFKTELYKKADGFVHYTKPSVIKSLVKEDSYFRFYCTKYMNDPDEGKILCIIDENLKEFYEHEKNEKDDFLTFIGSFMSSKKGKDKLPLWRFYGKGDDNKDARGMCIELDKDFFDYDKSIQINALPISGKSNKSSKKDTNSKLILNIYPVIYVDTINKNELIADLLSKIEKPLESIISDELYNNNKKFVKVAVRAVIDEIRYLIKSVHYKEEDEYRVVITLMKEDKRILVDNNGDEPKYYIDIKKNFKNYLKEIIIGPAVKHKNEWKAYFILNGIDDKKIKFSECRFN